MDQGTLLAAAITLVAAVIAVASFAHARRAERRAGQVAAARHRDLVQYSEQIRELVAQINQNLASHGIALEVDERGLPTGAVMTLRGDAAARAAAAIDDVPAIGGSPPPSPAPPLYNSEDDE